MPHGLLALYPAVLLLPVNPVTILFLKETNHLPWSQRFVNTVIAFSSDATIGGYSDLISCDRSPKYKLSLCIQGTMDCIRRTSGKLHYLFTERASNQPNKAVKAV